MSNFNRYNQGFGKFGPLEQCDDGKLMYVTDHEKIVDEFLDDFDKLVDAHDELDNELQAKIDFLDPFFDKFWLSLAMNCMLIAGIFGTIGYFNAH